MGTDNTAPGEPAAEQHTCAQPACKLNADHLAWIRRYARGLTNAPLPSRHGHDPGGPLEVYYARRHVGLDLLGLLGEEEK